MRASAGRRPSPPRSPPPSVQALVLAGGEGTRMRPLTLGVPKPVVPLAGRPFLTFMLDWLASHGVEEAILSCGFRAGAVERVLGSRHAGIRLRYVNEREPLGTAGPVRLAADLGLLDRRLLVLNGDVLTDLDLGAELAEHERTGAAATLALVAVDDPASYGVVRTGPDGRVEAFLEKAEAGGASSGARVNAGAYVLEREVAERIPAGRAVSFEREVFPDLVGRGLHGHRTEGYWIDIGTPERYLEATWDLLAGRIESTLPTRDRSGSLVLEGAVVEGADVGPLSVVGAGCVVRSGATVERSVLHDGVDVGEECDLAGCILAERVNLDARVRVERGAVIGSEATIRGGAVVAQNARIAPRSRLGPGDRALGAAPAGGARERVG